MKKKEEQEGIDQLREDILKSRSQENKLQYWLDNLHENKIIYRERFIILAELENIELDYYKFSANLKPISFVYIPRRLTLKRNQHKIQETLNRSWEIGFNLEFFQLNNKQQKVSSYSSFTMWTDPSLVQKAEFLVNNGKLQEAMNLIS